jgi:hypothetical protein
MVGATVIVVLLFLVALADEDVRELPQESVAS